MIAAMARGYRVLGEESFLDSARRAARFVEARLEEGGRLLATYRSGRAHLKAYLDDYAFLLGGYVELFESDFDPHWLERANALAAQLKALFWDHAIRILLHGVGSREAHQSDEERVRRRHPFRKRRGRDLSLEARGVHGVERTDESRRGDLARFSRADGALPSAFAQMLAAVDHYLGEKRELVVVGRGGCGARARGAAAPLGPVRARPRASSPRPACSSRLVATARRQSSRAGPGHSAGSISARATLVRRPPTISPRSKPPWAERRSRRVLE